MNGSNMMKNTQTDLHGNTAKVKDRYGDLSDDPIGELHSDLINGFLYTHKRINMNTQKLLEVAAFSYALIELLNEKGIVIIDDLDVRKEEVLKRIIKKFQMAGMGAMLQEPEQDKYRFNKCVEIDCENRLHLCKAVCCKMAFALSRQDIEEGIVRWDIGCPYMNARGSNDYCVHLEPLSCKCTIYKHRPLPCRAYDCRDETRIWQNFENYVVNPNLDSMFILAKSLENDKSNSSKEAEHEH